MYEEDSPHKVMYCCGVYQPLFDDMEDNLTHFTMHQGLPTLAEIEEFADGKHALICLDDMMHQVLDSKEMELLFTQTCHHKRISVIFITQNLYGRGKSARTIALNSSYLVLFKNIRGTSQIATLGRQLFPGKANTLVESFQDSTAVAFGYLLIDLTQRCREDYRLRSKVFPGEDTVVYRPNRL